MKTGKRAVHAVVLCAIVVMAALLPVSEAIAEPTIQLLNPSGYSDPPTRRISTKEDANGDSQYHLVAWVGDLPANPFVEFEVSVQPAIPGQDDPASVATVNGVKVGNDTFEGFLSTNTIPDGQYFVRAVLYEGFLGPGTGQDVAVDEEVVTFQSSGPTALNTVEMSYPDNGGPLGFWRSGNTGGAAVITGFASAGTNQVRVLYTTTDPGGEPVWTSCGSGVVGADRDFRARCTLNETHTSGDVTAVAAVANQTPPPGPPQAAGDQTGDAHRVAPYAQSPTRVTIEPFSSQTDVAKCTNLVATVLDQSSIPIAGINVDVHAQGPDDQLRFATRLGVNSDFQPPDAAHAGTEPTFKCAATDADDRQGEHNVPLGNDLKHIESTGGTNNQGQFTMVLYSGTNGATEITAWADENDDDSLSATTEASGTAQLGWGQAPPPPKKELNVDPSAATATTGECERLTATATQNGAGQAGLNVDIHITGPSGVEFCDPGDANVASPNSGDHSGNADNGQQNTFHAEGSTNSSGQVIFGITSSTNGETNVTAWLDENDSDTPDGSETLTAATVEWQQEGGRSIDIRSSKNRVRRGARVTLSGQLVGADACTDSQGVKVQAKKKGASRFRTVASDVTDDGGRYSVKERVRRRTQFRAIAPKNGPCERARSSAITVRTRR